MSIVIFSILVVISLRLGFRPFGKKSLVIAKWLISGLSVATSIVNGEIARFRLRNMLSTTKYTAKGVGVGLGGIPEFDSQAVAEWGTLDQWSKGSKVHSQFDFHKPSKQQVANWDIPALADLLIEGHKQKLAFAFGCLFGQAQLDEYELKCPKCGGDDVYLYNHKTCGVLWMKYPIEGFTVDDPELLHIAGQAMRDWEKERDKGKYADRHVYLGVSR